MKNYVKLYEDFDPAMQKKKIAQRLKVLSEKDKKYKEQMASATKRGDTLQASIIQNRMEINQLEKEKSALKNGIVDLKIKKMKG
jgi:uncharacterized protein (DUF3084 family)